MSAGLVHDAFLGVNEEQGSGSRSGAGHHVLQELLVAGGVDDRVGTLLGAEEDARGINRDILLLFLDQGVEQKSIFELHAFGGTVLTDLFDLTVRQGVGVVEEAADEGGLAVVDVTDDDDVHLALVFGGGLGGSLGGGGTRKGRGTHGWVVLGVVWRCGGMTYMNPLARSSCMELRPTWSWARPARSLTLVSLSSSMTSSMLLAGLSTGCVIGWQPSERKRLPSRAK